MFFNVINNIFTTGHQPCGSKHHHRKQSPTNGWLYCILILSQLTSLLLWEQLHILNTVKQPNCKRDGRSEMGPLITEYNTLQYKSSQWETKSLQHTWHYNLPSISIQWSLAELVDNMEQEFNVHNVLSNHSPVPSHINLGKLSIEQPHETETWEILEYMSVHSAQPPCDSSYEEGTLMSVCPGQPPCVSSYEEGTLMSRELMPVSSQTLWLLECPHESITWAPSNKMRNKCEKIKNGNRSKSLNIIHWNSGSCHWIRKRDELNHLIHEFNPDLLFVSEASKFNFHPEHETHIDGFSVITSKTMDKYGYSRLNLLVKDGIEVKVLSHLMNSDIASIWVSIQSQGNKKFNLCGVYREHKILLQGDPDLNPTKSIRAQELRWKTFLRQCTTAAASNIDCILTGDFNIDFVKWNSPDQHHSIMTEDTKAELETQGFIQLVDKPTRFWPGHTPSLLDHTWTNNQR